MSSPKATFLDGIHIPPNKSLTDGQEILSCPAPDFVYLPLSMHIGAPASRQTKARLPIPCIPAASSA